MSVIKMSMYGIMSVADINPYLGDFVEFWISRETESKDYTLSIKQGDNTIGFCHNKELKSGLEITGKIKSSMIKEEWITSGWIGIELNGKDDLIYHCRMDNKAKTRIGEISVKMSSAYIRKKDITPNEESLPYSHY